jgi:ankyrin
MKAWLLIVCLTPVLWAQDLEQLIRNGSAGEIRPGMKLNQPDNNGETPLQWAVSLRRPEMVKALLKAGARPDVADRYQQTPLFKAAETGQTQVAGLLLQYGARVDYPDQIGVTPLEQACLYDHPELVRLLLKHGAYPQKAVVQACTFGSERCLKLLLQAGAQPGALESDGNSPVHLAAQCGSLACLELLLKSGWPPNLKNKAGQTPLELALLRRQQPLAARLAELTPLTPGLLKTAVEVGNLTIVERAVQLDPALLPVAAESGQAEVMKYLLQRGLAVDSRDSQGLTAYLAAAQHGRRDLMEMALAQGANPDLKDRQGLGAVELLEQNILAVQNMLEWESRKRAITQHCRDLKAELRRCQATLEWLQKG